MKVIEFRDNELVISDEAYLIKAFKALWDDDKSKDKSKALAAFSYLYFYYHPASDYNYIVDEDEKSSTICESCGIDDLGFLEDEVFKKAVEVYQKMVVTTSSKILRNNRHRIDKLDNYLNDMVLDDDNIGKYTKALSDVNKLSVEIAKAEMDIYKDVEEQSAKVRGKVELSIGDRM